MQYNERDELLAQKLQNLKEHMYEDVVARALFLSDVNKEKLKASTCYKEVNDSFYLDLYLDLLSGFDDGCFENMKLENDKLFIDILKTSYSRLPESMQNNYLMLAREGLLLAQKGIVPTNHHQKIAKALYSHFSKRHDKARMLALQTEYDSTSITERYQFGDLFRVYLVQDTLSGENYAIFRDGNLMFHKLTMQQGIDLAEGYAIGRFIYCLKGYSLNPVTLIRTEEIKKAFVKWDEQTKVALAKPLGGKIPSIFSLLNPKTHKLAQKAIAKQSKKSIVDSKNASSRENTF